MAYIAVILPIILLAIGLYSWSYQNASEELSKQTPAQLNYYLDDLHREIEWIEMQQFEFIENNELNKLAGTWELMDSIEKRNSMNVVLQRLASLKNSSTYIKDVYIHIRTIDRSVSVLNSMYAFDQQKYNFFWFYIDIDTGRIVPRGDTLNLVALKYGSKKGELPLFIIQIELDQEQLESSLRQFSLQPNSGSFLISKDSGYMLANDAEAEPIMYRFAGQHDATKQTEIIAIDGEDYYINKVYSEKLDLLIAHYVPLDTVKGPLRRVQIWAWSFFVFSLFAFITYSYTTHKIVNKPLAILIDSFRKVELGNTNFQIKHSKKDEFGFLYNRFNLMISNLKRLVDQDFNQKMMVQRAEIKQLQSQINPHFLYNSFFILGSLAQVGDIDRIERFSNMLGEYFRYITRNDEDVVLLSEETRHSYMYTEIQKVRFSKRIQVDFAPLPPEMGNIRVPKLIIQPIIENAYEHSLENTENEGMLRVSFEMDDHMARIIVEDNGEHLRDFEIEALKQRMIYDESTHEMTGMVNIHRRLLLMYGEMSGLFISRSELGGLKIVIQIEL